MYRHPVYLTYVQSTSYEMPGWMSHKLESRLQGRNTNNFRCADDTTLMTEGEEELKSLLMRVKEESEKAGLKFNIQKLRLWHLVPFLENRRGKAKAVTHFLFLNSSVTADGDCSHGIRRCLLLEGYEKPRQHIKKKTHHFAYKGPYSQSYGFSSSHVCM